MLDAPLIRLFLLLLGARWGAATSRCSPTPVGEALARDSERVLSAFSPHSFQGGWKLVVIG